MPKLSVWAIRAALIYFMAAALVGSVLLAGKAVMLPAALWVLRPFHVEALLFGFMVQLVIGVAFWMLPRAPVKVGERGIGWALVLLNAGVWLAAAGGMVPGGAGMLLAGRLCEVGAVALFAVHVWPRVRDAKLVRRDA